MDDLVERLRSFADFAEQAGGPAFLLREAATRIEDVETAAKRVVTFSVQSGYEQATVQRVTEELHRVLSAGEPTVKQFPSSGAQKTTEGSE